jgi:hypothetical protein
LTYAVSNGQVPEERVTDMAMRIVASWYKVISFHPTKKKYIIYIELN